MAWSGEFGVAALWVPDYASAHFTPQESYGDWVEELTPEQRAVLYGPGVHHGGRLPLLESDGEQVRVLENA